MSRQFQNRSGIDAVLKKMQGSESFAYARSPGGIIVQMKHALINITFILMNLSAMLYAQTPSELDTLRESVTLKPQQTSTEQQRIQKLTDTPEKPLDGVTVKVLDVNVSKKSSVSVEYAPEVKQGTVIDNKEQTTVNYNLKF